MLRKTSTVVAAALMAAGCYTSSVQADDTQPGASTKVQIGANRPIVDVETDTNRAAVTRIARRASDVQGMRIENEAGESLGTVRDLVIDTDQARVKYIAVSYGGFLGLGSKLFAVPFNAFEYRPATQDEKAVLLLNLDETTLRKAPGFDADNWPNMASPEFASTIDRHYGDRERKGGVSIQAGPIGIRVGGERDTAPQKPSNPQAIERAADLLGMKVVNNADEKVGTIHDLMIDMTNGTVRYAALSVGGLAGIGDSLYAVPMSSFAVKHNPEDGVNELVLNVNPETLRNSKGFDQNHWPKQADGQFSTSASAAADRDVEAHVDVPGVEVNVD
ncbi:PRC-barrel domain-containing protein [Blastopirellula marina]|uniref:PRC-barrel domain-containing protein n=1 Tax=Blastopirellula marina TaxID=124 RepID=A0A2S8GQ63_9BACT|nr:PRC-barrel domain-containing protein [Blastopirellula marina]PQO46578.1 hypothetical protein C5Y93_08895 [Blastopirellula marina]